MWVLCPPSPPPLPRPPRSASGVSIASGSTMSCTRDLQSTFSSLTSASTAYDSTSIDCIVIDDTCKEDVASFLEKLLAAEEALVSSAADCSDLDDEVNNCLAYVQNSQQDVAYAVEYARKAVVDCDDMRNVKVCNEDLVYSFLGMYEAQATVLQSMKHCLGPPPPAVE